MYKEIPPATERYDWYVMHPRHEADLKASAENSSSDPGVFIYDRTIFCEKCDPDEFLICPSEKVARGVVEKLLRGEKIRAVKHWMDTETRRGAN